MIEKIVFFGGGGGGLFSSTILTQRDIVKNAVKIEKLDHKLISHTKLAKGWTFLRGLIKLKKYEIFKKAIFYMYGLYGVRAGGACWTYIFSKNRKSQILSAKLRIFTCKHTLLPLLQRGFSEAI